MTTKNNLYLSVAPKTKNTPKNFYDLSVECFKRSGLLGKKHINHFGRVFEGYDNQCDIVIVGNFDIFYREDMNENAREMLERVKLTTSGFDETGMQILERGEEILEILEKKEPLISLPWSTYRQLPFIEGMEMSTPCGIQSLHVHTTGGGLCDIIQFWKPKKDGFIYDIDTLKNYLFDSIIKNSDYLPDKPSLRKIIYHLFMEPRYKRMKNLWDKIMQDPDSIEKINL
jgi:hypothetical protein